MTPTKEAAVLTAEERALVNDIGDRLLELYFQRDEAVFDGDLGRVQELQAEIDDVKLARQKIVRSVDAP